VFSEDEDEEGDDYASDDDEEVAVEDAKELCLEQSSMCTTQSTPNLSELKFTLTVC